MSSQSAITGTPNIAYESSTFLMVLCSIFKLSLDAAWSDTKKLSSIPEWNNLQVFFNKEYSNHWNKSIVGDHNFIRYFMPEKS